MVIVGIDRDAVVVDLSNLVKGVVLGELDGVVTGRTRRVLNRTCEDAGVFDDITSNGVERTDELAVDTLIIRVVSVSCCAVVDCSSVLVRVTAVLVRAAVVTVRSVRVLSMKNVFRSVSVASEKFVIRLREVTVSVRSSGCSIVRNSVMVICAGVIVSGVDTLVNCEIVIV